MKYAVKLEPISVANLHIIINKILCAHVCTQTHTAVCRANEVRNRTKEIIMSLSIKTIHVNFVNSICASIDRNWMTQLNRSKF